jgi:uncharacterized repeat protein (TIGR01451 family)
MKKLSLALFIFIVLGTVVVPSYNVITGNLQSAEAFSSGGGGEGGCGGCGGGDGDGSGSGEPQAPTCDIQTSISSANEGDIFRISWSGTPAAGSTFTVNGTPSDAVDFASYTWPVGRTNPIVFTMVGNNGGGSCTDSVTITRKPTPAPACDAFNITQSTVAPSANLTFNWSTTNVSNVSFNNGIGSQSVDGVNRTFQAPSTPGTYTYILTFGGQTSYSCRDTVTVKTPVVPVCEDPAATNTGGSLPCVYPTPVCNAFSITQSTVAPSANLTFNWSTTNVSNVSFNNGIGSQSVDGVNRTFQAPSTPGTYTYILTFGGNTNASCVDTVTVEEPVVDAPVCVAFTATPTEIIKGESITLNWEVVNAVTLGLNNGIGDVTGTTTFGPVSPISNTTYILDVFGAGGTKVQCEAPVTVTDPVDPTDPAISIIKRDAIDKDDTQAVEVGGTAAFEIVVTNTGDEDLVNVVVTDPLEPACDKTIGSLAIGASDTYTCNTTNVQTAFTNVANVTGDSAVDGQTVTDTDPTDVTIVNTEVFTCADNVSFTASDTSIDEGDSSRLSWNVTGADSVSISGISATGLTGSEDVSPSSDTRYTLTATKAGFSTINCDVNIDVSSGGGGGGGSSSPRCELEISDTNINRGDEITLTWDSSLARELILTDDRGNVLVTTEDKLSDDKEEFFEGEITLTPTRDTEYTLRVERGSRDRECVVDVEMEDDEIVLLQTRDQAPLVAGISLTEVPYTGFEAGSVMTFMFYALLVAWALYITYVLVIPKSMLSAAPVLVTPRTTSDLMTNAESIRPDVFAALPTKSVVASSAPTAAAPANLPVAQPAPVSAVAEETDTATTATEVENEAHLHQALLSSGAVQSLIAMTTDADRSQTLTKVIANAKGAYPLEDGWVVINQTRLTELTTVPAAPATTAVTGNGSLAEAIVTGNVVAAYELIGDRPMFALADASADLDALYRNRKGANEEVSDLLTTVTTDITDAQIADMIAALTGAIDGTYTDEASAVKMAIMKAVKIAA